MGNKGERFRKDPTTKPRKESQNGGLTDSPKLQTSSPQIWKSTATHELQPRQSFSTYHHLQNEHKNVKFGARDQKLQRFEGGKKLTACRRTGSKSSKRRGSKGFKPSRAGVKGISSPPQWERAESTRFSHAEESSPHALPGVKREKEALRSKTVKTPHSTGVLFN